MSVVEGGRERGVVVIVREGDGEGGWRGRGRRGRRLWWRERLV